MNIIRFSISEAYHSRLAASLMPLMKPRNASVLGSEPVVEPLGHLLHVERLGHPQGGIDGGDFLFLFGKREAQDYRAAPPRLRRSALCCRCTVGSAGWLAEFRA